jgi:uncharacterized protein YdhG (YjbR/CyaY superfamily)
MKSYETSVDDYLKEVPEKRISVLTKIRQLCLSHLPDHDESMTYNMPSYVRNGQVEVAFASQKQHICIYFLIHEVMLNNQDRLKGLNHGKGAIRYTNPDTIDFKLITYLLDQTNKSEARIC